METMATHWEPSNTTTTPSIVYVCACWFGKRYAQHLAYIRNPYIYIKRQVESLRFLNHNLHTIIFVINKDGDGLYEKAKDFIPNEIKGSKVEILYRDNIGLSYGAYNFVYEKYREKFEYYIFIEDDYIFVQHNFDRHMTRMFQDISNCGYLCGRTGEVIGGGRTSFHGSISSGIASSRVLENVYQREGMLPYDDEDGVIGQVLFTQSFWRNGFVLSGFGDKYGVIYNVADGGFKYFDCDKPIMYLPQQYLESEKNQYLDQVYYA